MGRLGTGPRYYGFRVSKTFDQKVTFAASAEAPQATVGGRGFSTYTNTSTGVVTTHQRTPSCSPRRSGGLEELLRHPPEIAVNKAWTILKMALIRLGHHQLFGVVQTYQNRVYPCAASEQPRETSNSSYTG